MDWIDTLNIIFSFIGISFFIYGLQIITRIKKLFPKAKIMKYWNILVFLISFFIIGYLVNIITLVLGMDAIVHLMTALVFFMGATFVLGVIQVSFLTYRLIKEAAEESPEE